IANETTLPATGHNDAEDRERQEKREPPPDPRLGEPWGTDGHFEPTPVRNSEPGDSEKSEAGVKQIIAPEANPPQNRHGILKERQMHGQPAIPMGKGIQKKVCPRSDKQ